MRTQIEQLRAASGRRKVIFDDAGSPRQERADSERATHELSEARSRVENLEPRVTDLDRSI